MLAFHEILEESRTRIAPAKRRALLVENVVSPSKNALEPVWSARAPALPFALLDSNVTAVIQAVADPRCVHMAPPKPSA